MSRDRNAHVSECSEHEGTTEEPVSGAAVPRIISEDIPTLRSSATDKDRKVAVEVDVSIALV